MWTFRVVVDPPVFDDFACFTDAREPVLVQAFLSEPAIEAFDVGILGRLAGINEVQLNALVISPRIKRPTAQFRAITPSE